MVTNVSKKNTSTKELTKLRKELRLAESQLEMYKKITEERGIEVDTKENALDTGKSNGTH